MSASVCVCLCVCVLLWISIYISILNVYVCSSFYYYCTLRIELIVWGIALYKSALFIIIIIITIIIIIVIITVSFVVAGGGDTKGEPCHCPSLKPG